MTMYHSISSILLNSPIDTPNTSVAPEDPHLHGWMQLLIAYMWFKDGDLNSLEDMQQYMNLRRSGDPHLHGWIQLLMANKNTNLPHQYNILSYVPQIL